MPLKEWWNEFQRDFKNKALVLFIFLIVGILVWLLVQLTFIFYGFSFIDWIKNVPYVYDTFLHIFTEARKGTSLGVFYLFTFGSLFFFPVPLEVVYFTLKDMPFTVLFPLAVGGILLGQVVNYFLGRFFGFILLGFFKKRTQRRMKEKLERYGPFAVTAVHIIPFPFQLFNFFTGVFRYNFFKWILFAFIGLVLKHLAMYWLFTVF